jgi:putative tryptophan/tyrosine transport system substrate-binding protein
LLRSGDGMKRREFIGLVAALAASPSLAWAQRPARAVIGYLSSASEASDTRIIGELKKGLAELGFVEGSNVVFISQWSEGDYSRLEEFASGLIARKADVLVASGLPATLAAQKATSTIPIVFRFAIDPVAHGVVQSFDRPGGNLTGATMLFDPLTPKKLQLLHELVGGVTIGFLVNPSNQNVASHLDHAATAAKALGLKLATVKASRPDEIELAFAAAKQQSVAAVLLGDDPLFFTRRDDVIRAAAALRIPTMYYVRDFTDAGGLISYGPSFDEMARHTGRYVGRILNGAKPAELPVLQPTRFEFVINLKTARAQGIAVPAALLARADEVIE